MLVGKGITFDSGGLSLKPNDGMVAMKTDMAGGAAVIAVHVRAARLGVRRRVTGLVAAAENMPSGSAYRPGDVITQYGGTTVEVLNTDAEGRLVLADAMAYAGARAAPGRDVDLATLTGAARVALGTTHAALYATDDALASALTAAGEASGDRVWRMPLEDGYAPALESDVADICHIARDGSPGLDHGRAVPARVRGRAAVGAPGHRRDRPLVGERGRAVQGRHRVRRPAAAGPAGRLARPPRRPLQVALDRGQQPVADRQQQRHQALVAADQLAELAGGGAVVAGRRPEPRASSKATIPPGRSSRSAAAR